VALDHIHRTGQGIPKPPSPPPAFLENTNFCWDPCPQTSTGSRVSERGTYLREFPRQYSHQHLDPIHDHFRAVRLYSARRQESDCFLRRASPTPAPHRATHLHVRFRFDKCPQNFTIRKSRRTCHEFLCPILASLSVVYRASALSVPTQLLMAHFAPAPAPST
jgi:hypothetical protein